MKKWYNSKILLYLFYLMSWGFFIFSVATSYKTGLNGWLIFGALMISGISQKQISRIEKALDK